MPVVSGLPKHPDLDQARRQAKELVRAARAGDAGALRRLAAVSAPLTLAGAQLALARELGQPSWMALVREIQARSTSIPENVSRFLRCSVNLQIGQAARMLHEDPTLADSGFAAAVVLGDVAQVKEHLRRDPGAATRVDPDSGWSALHLVCASRFHLDPARAPGLAEVARLLLDAGAEIDGQSRGRRCWRPLDCAVTSANSSANNEPIIRLLLDRGAPVRAETLCASLYAADGSWCLKLLCEHAPRQAALYTYALAEAAARADRDALAVLLGAGADPDAPGWDGVSARRQALRTAVGETVWLLGGEGSDPVDRLLEAALAGDGTAARALMAAEPGLLGRLESGDRATLVNAAERGNTSAVALMLDLGFPIDARRTGINAADDDGASALHAAAWAGAAETVALLLDRGADVCARDTRWRGQPLAWALIGSGESPDFAPAPDWVATVALLLDAGAPSGEIAPDPEEPKPPSPAVRRLLRSRGLIGDAQSR